MGESELIGPQAPAADCYAVLWDRLSGCEVVGPLTEEELRRKLTSLCGTPTRAFAFRGGRYRVSKGPLRFLLAPDGRALPLFDDPDELEPDEDDSLGDVTDERPPPSPPDTGEDDDDEDDDRAGGFRPYGDDLQDR